jgi:hypothetical protein
MAACVHCFVARELGRVPTPTKAESHGASALKRAKAMRELDLAAAEPAGSEGRVPLAVEKDVFLCTSRKFAQASSS